MIETRYLPEVPAAQVVVTGEMSMAEYGQAIADLMAAPWFTPGLGAIWDFRGGTLRALGPDQLRKIAEYNREIASRRGPRWRVAVLVSCDVDFGLTREFEAYAVSVPIEVRIVDDLAEATRWLAAAEPGA
ncbi:MAG: hypothetical protein ACE5IK_04210 [Acidobacteriota bacterium]